MTFNAEELAPVQPTLGTTDEYDFVSPQILIDEARRREKRELHAAQTYILQQHTTLPTVQTLVPLCKVNNGPSYTIRLDTGGGNKLLKSHRSRMLIVQYPGDRQVAEVKLGIRGGGDATIVYNNKDSETRTSQKLSMQNPRHEQRFNCLVNGTPHQWHPLGPSKCVFELTNRANKRVALFVLAEGISLSHHHGRTGSSGGPGNPLPFLRQSQKIGEVHLLPDFEQLFEPIGLRQEMLFSAVVVVELTRRWATNQSSNE